MSPVKLYYLNRCTSENTQEKFGIGKNTSNSPSLVPPQPGKGLNMFVNRIVKFCQTRNNVPPYKIPRSSIIVPQARPNDHKLSFIDDPPYSTTIGKDVVRPYQIPRCNCCTQAYDKTLTNENIGKVNSENIFLRNRLPKWIHAKDVIK